MNTSEFVQIWKKEAESIYKDHTSGNGDTAVSKLLEELELSEDKKKIANKIIETLLIDTHYTFLMGLAGCANIGGIQQDYVVMDEAGNKIFEPGDLEAEAYEQFQEESLI